MQTAQKEIDTIDFSENGHSRPDLSVVIAVRQPDKAAPIAELYATYKEQIEKLNKSYEFVFILEGKHTAFFDALVNLKETGEPIKILVFARLYGEATALTAGFDHASGDVILTLPAYHQIDPASIPSLFDEMKENDMVIVRRWPRVDGKVNRTQTRLFHFFLKKMMGVSFHDLTCSIRVLKRSVIEHVHMYGDQQRFFPILASRFGFRVKEVEVAQAKEDAFDRRFSAGVYLRRFLDLLSIFFLVKFTAKPLRFFGLNSFFVFSLGLILTLILVFQRIFTLQPLADRPALLFGVLLIVLGVLLFAIGLIGELIIFVNARELKEYRIEKIVN